MTVSLLDSEVVRIKAELGYALLTHNAGPNVGNLLALFDQVIAPHVHTGALSTCTTLVEATATPTARTLALVGAGTVAAGATVVIDVDSRQEKATVRSATADEITCLLSKAHGPGLYPVAVEGGESMIRGILAELTKLTNTIASLRNRVGVSKVDEIELFGGGSTLGSVGVDPLTHVFQLRESWRDELAHALGIRRLNSARAGAGNTIALH